MSGKEAGKLLVAADEVQGTAVLDAKGSKIGTIEDLMLDKRTGKVAYAVLNFGGFLGVGERRCALPWPAGLQYRREEDAYMLGAEPDRLSQAPGWGVGERPSWEDEAWLRGVCAYWECDYPG